MSLKSSAIGLLTFVMDALSPLEGERPSKNAMKRAARNATPAVVLKETRQIRRARERAEKKGRKV